MRDNCIAYCITCKSEHWFGYDISGARSELASCRRIRLPAKPQRQDSLTDQLIDLKVLAIREGLHGAADWLEERIKAK